MATKVHPLDLTRCGGFYCSDGHSPWGYCWGRWVQCELPAGHSAAIPCGPLPEAVA